MSRPATAPLVAKLGDGTLWAIVPVDDWIQVQAEATQARIAQTLRDLERVVSEAEASGLPSGARPSWRRGIWGR